MNYYYFLFIFIFISLPTMILGSGISSDIISIDNHRQQYPSIREIRICIDQLDDINDILLKFKETITPVHQDLPLEDIVCTQYALMKTLNFNKSLNPKGNYSEKKVRRIIQHFFSSVNSSSQQNGDLVVYFDDKKEMVHFGICRDRGYVESKWGNEEVILQHPLLFCPRAYGSLCSFFRPNSTMNSERCFLEILSSKKRRVNKRSTKARIQKRKKPQKDVNKPTKLEKYNR